MAAWQGTRHQLGVSDNKLQYNKSILQATAREEKCVVGKCDYSTLSRRKLLDHLITNYIIQVTNCDYMTTRRGSAVKHLRTCHDWLDSITQTDAGSWRRLGESNLNLPTSCPLLHKSSYQYRSMSRCKEDKPVVSSLPISIKWIKTVESPQEPLARPEQPPIDKIEQRVELRRYLARLRKDYQAVQRLKNHTENDCAELEPRLGKKRRC